MKKLLCALLLVSSVNAYSQYYYSDILGTKQTNQQYQLMHSSQVKRVSATGFESNNQPTKDFLLEQQVANNGQQIITRSATIGTGESLFTSTYKDGRISRTYDSSAHAINTVDYTYDAQGRLVATHATSKDFDGKFSSTESHLWSYNENGLPQQMLKVKNGADTTYVTFKLDGQNNVSEEIWKKKNRTLETYYYYYDQQRLTDIVRFNRKANQHLPDYIFEYDANGRIAQMIQRQATSANYLVYRYVYNDRGLKEKEQVYNKAKEYLGKVEYTYQ
ncbi:hypothetical protein [Aridibaculum aurantiacum]|uniref:hypothetical protein n=1 Tax=Aridibaculum aurantiacum TaxID=2810307 RepID=UPI001A96FC5C|nr:hypothetical protein [Aridibaculum aurantiacum]